MPTARIHWLRGACSFSITSRVNKVAYASDHHATDVISVMPYQSRVVSAVYLSYSCFEKGCPTKPYATMPKGIMCNSSSQSFFEALGVSATWRETAQTNVFVPSLFSLVNTVFLNQSINSKLFLPIILIGIVAYAFTLLWDNLCRNSCIQYTDLLHPNIHGNFVWIIIEININPEGLDYY